MESEFDKNDIVLQYRNGVLYVTMYVTGTHCSQPIGSQYAPDTVRRKTLKSPRPGSGGGPETWYPIFDQLVTVLSKSIGSASLKATEQR